MSDEVKQDNEDLWIRYLIALMELNTAAALIMLEKCKTIEDMGEWKKHYLGKDSLMHKIEKILWQKADKQ